MVKVWKRGKIWFIRYAPIIGQKRPIFGTSREIYTENFGPGFHPGRRLEVPWGRVPWILVAAGLALSTLGLAPVCPFSRTDFRVSQVRVGRLKFQRFLDMCFKF